MRELRTDEIEMGYRLAVQEQEEILAGYQEQRKSLRLEWAKLQAYMSECSVMANDPGIGEKLQGTLADLEEIENQISYHQKLAMALERKASTIGDQWSRPQEPVRLGARLGAR